MNVWLDRGTDAIKQFSTCNSCTHRASDRVFFFLNNTTPIIAMSHTWTEPAADVMLSNKDSESISHQRRRKPPCTSEANKTDVASSCSTDLRHCHIGGSHDEVVAEITRIVCNRIQEFDNSLLRREQGLIAENKKYLEAISIAYSLREKSFTRHVENLQKQSVATFDRHLEAIINQNNVVLGAVDNIRQQLLSIEKRCTDNSSASQDRKTVIMQPQPFH